MYVAVSWTQRFFRTWHLVLFLIYRQGRRVLVPGVLNLTYANPIPSFRFGQIAKTKIVRANRKRFLVRRFFCSVSCDSAVRFLELRKFKPTSTTMSGAAPSALRSALDSTIRACAD